MAKHEFLNYLNTAAGQNRKEADAALDEETKAWFYGASYAYQLIAARMAAQEGFEPSLSEPKSDVLPLDDRATPHNSTRCKNEAN